MTDQELAEAANREFTYVHVDVDGVSEIVDNLRGCETDETAMHDWKLRTYTMRGSEIAETTMHH